MLKLERSASAGRAPGRRQPRAPAPPPRTPGGGPGGGNRLNRRARAHGAVSASRLLSSTTSSSVSTSPGAAARPRPAWGRTRRGWRARDAPLGGGAKAARALHEAQYNVSAVRLATFMPAPDAPTPTPPRTKQTLDETGGVPGSPRPGSRRRPDVRGVAERRKLERAFALAGRAGVRGGTGSPPRQGDPERARGRRDDAPGASPVRAGARRAARAEEQKAKPKPALPPPPEEQKAKPKPVAPPAHKRRPAQGQRGARQPAKKRPRFPRRYARRRPATESHGARRGR